MQDSKRKNGNEDSKKKERHIVTWTQQEDDILREQISIHGTENWTIITSKFKDKTTRQCRRRWYTYLNSDFKKGGWSPEEDMLLCEAQKIFGNRWTEIAKVVSGRTDNAVKNRFSTLCKKKAKYEALAKENATSFLNSNNKRVISQNEDGTSETVAPVKRMRRAHISDLGESKQNTTSINQQLRPPFAVLVQNVHSGTNSSRQHHVSNTKEVANNAHNTKIQGTFLKKDDPKINALMEQAELLSSLALKVNTENTDGSLENAWKALQDFLNQNKESNIFGCGGSDIDFQVEDLKDLVDDLRRCNDQNHPSWRQPDLYEDSSCSSDYSTGSTLLIHALGDKTEQNRAESGEFNQNTGSGFETIQGSEDNGVVEYDKGIHANQAEILPPCDEQTNNEVVFASSSTDFSSPLQVTPLFRSLAAGIPSPKFSESERSFLLKTLGLESPLPNPSLNPSQPPPCKRALLHIL